MFSTRPMLRSWTRAVAPRGFTLIELLGVVTIIVVLLALIAPALDRAVEAAQRVKCASQLKIIHTSSRIYADANRGTFFISRYRAAPHGFNAIAPFDGDKNDGEDARALPGDMDVDWIEALYTVGLTVGPKKTMSDAISTRTYRDPAPVWNCPSTAQKSVPSTEYKCISVRYQYFGGHHQWYNLTDKLRESRSPVKVSRSEGHWVLATDYTMKPGAWNANHMDSERRRAAGGNQVCVDGSVEWVDLDRMAFITGWAATQPVFFWQSDLGPEGIADPMKAKAFK